MKNYKDIIFKIFILGLPVFFGICAIIGFYFNQKIIFKAYEECITNISKEIDWINIGKIERNNPLDYCKQVIR
ncbi:hypothetical protein IPJ63_03765 [Candidatus Nomurabacteria bacterium]|nr:MAG: hypothetical protein IPJ63_03765 [Candidatus Nomurabacteria bacterium]